MVTGSPHPLSPSGPSELSAVNAPPLPAAPAANEASSALVRCLSISPPRPVPKTDIPVAALKTLEGQINEIRGKKKLDTLGKALIVIGIAALVAGIIGACVASGGLAAIGCLFLVCILNGPCYAAVGAACIKLSKWLTESKEEELIANFVERCNKDSAVNALINTLKPLAADKNGNISGDKIANIEKFVQMHKQINDSKEYFISTNTRYLMSYSNVNSTLYQELHERVCTKSFGITSDECKHLWNIRNNKSDISAWVEQHYNKHRDKVTQTLLQKLGLELPTQENIASVHSTLKEAFSTFSIDDVRTSLAALSSPAVDNAATAMTGAARATAAAVLTSP